MLSPTALHVEVIKYAEAKPEEFMKVVALKVLDNDEVTEVAN